MALTRRWRRRSPSVRAASSGATAGMLITRCNCIHTCFMRFPIDATFLDGRGAVVKVVRDIRPWRLFVWGGFRAAQVLETAAGTAPLPGKAP